MKETCEKRHGAGVIAAAAKTAAAVALVAIGWLGRESVGFRETPRGAKEAEPTPVAAIIATNALFNPPAVYVGHVEPAEVTDILPQIDGYIRRVCFTEGAKVEKGDLLFEIDDEQYLAAKNLRHSEVASAEARVTVAQAEVDRAERYYRRLAAVDERGVTATERDTAETTLASAKAALNAANAAVGQARASAAIADFNLRHTKIHSPISGRIGRAMRHVGDYVSPSKSPLARVVRTDPMRVVFPVSDRDYDAWQAAAERGGRAVGVFALCARAGRARGDGHVVCGGRRGESARTRLAAAPCRADDASSLLCERRRRRRRPLVRSGACRRFRGICACVPVRN